MLNRQAELDLQAFPNGVWEREKLPDLNQDNLADYLIIYPNGDQQVLYQLP